MNSRYRILGIDPGSRRTGFGVVDFIADRAIYVASGSVTSTDGSFPERLKLIYRSVGEIVEEFGPDAVAIESVFVHRSAGSALKLGQARAAAICATFGSNVSVHEYAPREIKQAVVGTGGASKEQVQHMVVSLLALNGSPSPDAADAIAAALCHGHQRRLTTLLRPGGIAAGLR
ncbi:MAG: crossover junction endodeoxyribonuclease RuvC [Gammaproteobacteria bacterium]|nr:crossover junction endodeoxyribonuclease RuvC [Gammaproteobacteria bacterium]